MTVNLFQHAGIRSIPVDAWSIARRMGIKLVPFSSLTEEQLSAAQSICSGGLKLRFSNQHGHETRCILYDDRNPIGRQRFSILHEIGHIALGHKQDSMLADAEADFFAKYAIAPPMLVHLIKPSDYIDIAQAFGLSDECAYNSMSYYNKWLNIPGYSEYEYRLIEMFTVETSGGGRVLRVS